MMPQACEIEKNLNGFGKLDDKFIRCQISPTIIVQIDDSCSRQDCNLERDESNQTTA
jgi:hypothetical protein